MCNIEELKIHFLLLVIYYLINYTLYIYFVDECEMIVK